VRIHTNALKKFKIKILEFCCSYAPDGFYRTYLNSESAKIGPEENIKKLKLSLPNAGVKAPSELVAGVHGNDVLNLPAQNVRL
jgi:hypothetical protein